ncbi:unnamed protein product [Brachionus calyciflorus]|uniref:Uncharacterized protein n=1 Tax=Brachionus calyciflorus TaxID=104777 RepID=A0A814QLE6_9BILA|nr:unnamed protein product [Brachionus calyciflorus]
MELKDNTITYQKDIKKTNPTLSLTKKNSNVSTQTTNADESNMETENVYNYINYSISENFNVEEHNAVEYVPCTSTQAEINPQFSVETALNDQEFFSNLSPQNDIISDGKKKNLKRNDLTINTGMINLDIPRFNATHKDCFI